MLIDKFYKVPTYYCQVASKYLPISSTRREKLILTHIQDKNIHGKVFGGYVMREAVELAWSVAYLSGDGSNPKYVQIDDVIFIRPIPVGSITDFQGSII